MKLLFVGEKLERGFKWFSVQHTKLPIYYTAKITLHASRILEILNSDQNLCFKLLPLKIS